VIEWRVFSERHRAAGVGTTFALGGDNAHANIAANSSQYLGTGVRIRAGKGDDPRGTRLLGDLRFESATTTDSVFARGALDFTLMQGVGMWGGALTLSAGSSIGDVPPQRLWYLGGTRTIRGQSPDTAQSGNAFWMSRFEFGREIQGARPVIFTDFGWAGDRTQWKNVGRPMSGVGLGASFMDGLWRFDVSRGIAPRRQWRVDAYLEGIF
jgi:hemolysin activation/secretion protein